MMTEMQDRWYQKECADALFDFVMSHIEAKELHPVAVIPTAGGKTHIACLFIDLILSVMPDANILISSHDSRIIEQDANAINNYFGFEPGIYSADLGIKTIRKITVASIQSIYKKAHLFKDFNICIIDEAHMIPVKGNGMYRSFLQAIDAIYVGLTGSPYRLGHGYIHEGEGALFTDVVYNLCDLEKFNRLVDEGYLAKLYSKRTDYTMDTDGIPMSMGDFNEQKLSFAFNREGITRKIVKEICYYGKHYKHWAVYCIDIEHAEQTAKFIREKGISVVCVHSKNPDSKQQIKDYKAGKYQCIVNVDMLTTGFDYPEIDLIAVLRPTKSPVIYVQINGRGLRPFWDKDHCLILDFAGNSSRLGPINDVRIAQKGKGKVGQAIIKECPECQLQWHPTVKVCACGYEFPFKVGLEAKAGQAEIVAKKKEDGKIWAEVKDITYSIHQRPGKIPCVCVTYNCGLQSFKDWVHLDHHGYAQHKARHWVRMRWTGTNESIPLTTADLYKRREYLKKPFAIYVDTSEKFPTILDSRF